MMIIILNAYLKIISPIANIDIESQKTNPLDAYNIAGGGMGFSAPTQTIQPTFGDAVGHGYAASLGPYGTKTDTRNILRKITIFHVYRQGQLMNVYNFYNPKITSWVLDELDMTGNDNEIAFTFSYDSLFIVPGYVIGGTEYNLNSITSRSGLYPFGIPVGANTTIANDGFGLTPGQNVQYLDGIQFGSGSTQLAGTTSISPGGLSSSSSGSTDPNTLASIAGNTTTTNVTPDPVTGTIPQSADNSGNMASVQSNASTQATSQIAAVTSTPATTLPESQIQFSQVQSIQSTQNSATSQSSTSTAPDGTTTTSYNDTTTESVSTETSGSTTRFSS
jgi:hypothetical protein